MSLVRTLKGSSAVSSCVKTKVVTTMGLRFPLTSRSSSRPSKAKRGAVRSSPSSSLHCAQASTTLPCVVLRTLGPSQAPATPTHLAVCSVDLGLAGVAAAPWEADMARPSVPRVVCSTDEQHL
jgi:hypothetical protein